MICLDNNNILSSLIRALDLAVAFCTLLVVVLGSPARDEFNCSILEPEVSKVKLLFSRPNVYLYEHIFQDNISITRCNFRLLVTRNHQNQEPELSSYVESTQLLLKEGLSGNQVKLSHVNCSDDHLGATVCWVNGYMEVYSYSFFNNYWRQSVSAGELRVQSRLICALNMVFRYKYEYPDYPHGRNYDQTPKGTLSMMSQLANEKSPFVGFHLQLSPYNVPAIVKPRNFMMCAGTNVSLDIQLNPLLKARTNDLAGHTRCELQVYNQFTENIIQCNFRLIQPAEFESITNNSTNNNSECECISWKNSFYTLIGATALTILLCISSLWWDRCSNCQSRQTNIFIISNDLPDHVNEVVCHKPVSPETSMEPESSMVNSSTHFRRSAFVPSDVDPSPSEDPPGPLRLPADPI